MEHLRRTRAEINLDNLRHNISVMRSLLKEGVEIMAVIKADCYGHGAVTMMEYMMKYGLRYFGVASLNEALELRRFHKDGSILVLGLTSDELLHHCVENDLVQTCCSLHQAEILSACGSKERPARIQIKVDTGLHRIGFLPTEENMDIVAQIAKLPNLMIEGVFSHIALGTREQDLHQGELLRQFIDGCARRGVELPLQSLDDGITCVKYPELWFNMVRPGSFFFGFSPCLEGLKPIMELKSEIVHLQRIRAGDSVGYWHKAAVDHDRVIATLPLGYVDGLPRSLSEGKGWVVIRGERCPIVGLICMDQCMVDVTAVPEAAIGDDVLIYSHKDGAMGYVEAAELCDFNKNGLQSAIPRRIPKVYFENGKEVAYRDYLFDKNA